MERYVHTKMQNSCEEGGAHIKEKQIYTQTHIPVDVSR